MSIYKRALGEQFYELHPMLQRRYAQLGEGRFHGSGVMKIIEGGPKWLSPIFHLGTKWKLLFPESGKNIPFTITNTARIGENGEEQVHWQRVFYFQNKERYFNALMSLDDEHLLIKDYLGEPPLMYSDLAFTVHEEDGSIIIQSKNQRLVLGKWEIPLPRFLQGLATVTERYIDEEEAYHIEVQVKNPLIGTVFSYEGAFTDEERELSG